MADLSVDFCGLKHINPFVVAASPSSDSREKVQRALDAGWAGVVFKTTATAAHSPSLAEPNMAGVPLLGQRQYGFYNIDLISERSIVHIQEDIAYFKRQYPDRILTGSIMADCHEDWQVLVNALEDAGADMIECSMSCPQGEHSLVTGGPARDAIPAADTELMRQTTAWIKSCVRKGTPVIVKMTPNVTDICAIANSAASGGADAVCAIDTVRAFIGLDLENDGKPLLNVDGYSTWGGLSGPAIKPIALGCVSRLAKETTLPIAGVGGISNWRDAAEFLLLGAVTVQVCTAITRYGFSMVGKMRDGLSDYMDRMGFAAVSDMVGHSLKYLVPHSQLSREGSGAAEIDESRCVSCGVCGVACRDAGFGAIVAKKGELPAVKAAVCRSCGVCRSVCPKDCISIGRA